MLDEGRQNVAFVQSKQKDPESNACFLNVSRKTSRESVSRRIGDAVDANPLDLCDGVVFFVNQTLDI